LAVTRSGVIETLSVELSPCVSNGSFGSIAVVCEGPILAA